MMPLFRCLPPTHLLSRVSLKRALCGFRCTMPPLARATSGWEDGERRCFSHHSSNLSAALSCMAHILLHACACGTPRAHTRVCLVTSLLHTRSTVERPPSPRTFNARPTPFLLLIDYSCSSFASCAHTHPDTPRHTHTHTHRHTHRLCVCAQVRWGLLLYEKEVYTSTANMPPNAALLNRLQIREQEALNRQRRMQDDAVARREAEALRRTKAQYNHVHSHGYGRAGSAGGGGADFANARCAAPSDSRDTSGEVQIRVYVRECDDEASQSFCYREATTANATSNTDPRSRASASTSATSHVARRGDGGGGGGGVTTASLGVVAPNRARVPRYLQQRKAELAAEKEAIAEEAERQRQLSLIPAGQRRVSAEEKADTLRQLDERQQELEAQLARIPIRFDTHSIQQRRRAIEEELREIETTRNKYSTKGTLFVPLC
ncbi:hypothetical protein, conserved [Leishmania tarentolae]|uniref:Enkurin domain-containing protein n=1 Tax=Leishmania tarentolae TaxID=5689 RepID=A0A640K766_LEITA|nr:hypothetical protein, conserved [Leishmania tarentolae]